MVDADAGIVALSQNRRFWKLFDASRARVGAHAHNGRCAAFVAALPGHGYTRKAVTARSFRANPAALRPAADAIAEAIAETLSLGGTGRLSAFRA